MTAGPTLTVAAPEGPLGPRSSPQLVPVAQFAPAATVGTSSITCTTVHSPTVTAKTATPRLRATLLQVEDFTKRVEKS